MVPQKSLNSILTFKTDIRWRHETTEIFKVKNNSISRRIPIHISIGKLKTQKLLGGGLIDRFHIFRYEKHFMSMAAIAKKAKCLKC